MSAEPRVTVLMPVFNGERYLEEALASIAAQDFRDFEFLIVDDASTDSTPEILARHASADPRIVVVRNEANLGLQKSLNRGLRLARGTYVARQDHDDISEPERLSMEVRALDADPDAVLVSTSYREIDSEGRVTGVSHRAAKPEIVDYFLHFGNALGGHTQVMFRRALALELGGYDESYRYSEDFELWTRMAKRGRILVLPEIGARYRVHGESATSTMDASIRRECTARVVQAALPGLLAREVSAKEARAVRVVCGRDLAAAEGPPTEGVSLAAAIFEEAYRRFEEGHADPGLRREVRRLTARRFARCAVAALMSWRMPGVAARSFVAGLRWDARRAVADVAVSMRRMLAGRLRAMVG